MTSPNPKLKRGSEFDALLMRCLKNWSDRKTPPTHGRQELMAEVVRYDLQQEGWRSHRLFRFLPEWLGAYLFENTWIIGKSEVRDQMQGVVFAESSYSIMTYLYRVRISYS